MAIFDTDYSLFLYFMQNLIVKDKKCDGDWLISQTVINSNIKQLQRRKVIWDLVFCLFGQNTS